MKYAFFQGCNIPIRIEQYAQSATTVCAALDVELKVMPEFNCCGYPMRNVDEKAYILPSMRNMALAEKAGLDIFVICNCCFHSLQKARNVLQKNPELTAELNAVLAKEGLCYTGKTVIKHFLTVLHQDVGLAAIKAKIVKAYSGLKVSVIHGCHLLRPREITNFDNTFVPEITDALVKATGATNLDWAGKLECCGAALAGINDELSHRLLHEKIDGAQAAGADYIVPICAYCHLQFDTMQGQTMAARPGSSLLPVLLFPQLLGLCLGLDAHTLGIAKNTTISSEAINHLQSLLGPPPSEANKKKKAKVAAPA